MQGFGSFKTLDVLLTCIGHSHYEVNLTRTLFYMLQLICLCFMCHLESVRSVPHCRCFIESIKQVLKMGFLQGTILPHYRVTVIGVFLSVHTHTHLTALFLGLPGWAGTRKAKTIWILLKQETLSGSGISWAICKSAPCSRQITTPAPHHSVFYMPDALSATQPTASKH